MFLTTKAKDVGIQPSKSFPRVYGAMMDWPVSAATVSVVSLCDGTASIYTTSTFGVLGGIGHETVRAAASRFVTSAERHFDQATLVTDFPYPEKGRVRFYFVCFDGVRMIEADESALKTGTDKCADLWNEGQGVMSELRKVTQNAEKK
ncbi:MAG: hypothetical protein JWR26_2025 [Pedosphaera sp.]|nr:hypothetical protein [Pedosphaera sp.]